MKIKSLYSKKGISSETAIISSFIFIFVIFAVCLPLIYSDFKQSTTSLNYNKIKNSAETQKSTGFSIWSLTGFPVIDVIISMFAMATWTFGGINIWIDLLLLTPVRIVFWIVIYKLIRSGT